MPERYLLDTDIIIEYLRGQRKAVAYLEALEGALYLSAITVAELFSGVKGEEEEQALEQFMLAFQVVDIDDRVAKKGGLYRREYLRSHSTGLADALIAASAESIGALLVTFNARHYPMFDHVEVPYRRV